jgi:methionyl-tRNA formyltransferase
MGSPQFAVPALRQLSEAGYEIAGVYTQPDRDAGRGRRLRPSPVKLTAEELGLSVFQPQNLRGSEAIEELRALQPDAIVVVAFGQILRPSVLQIPPQGVLNVHASLLPRYRGAAPVASAILDGLEATGVSIMLLDEGTDTGPVLAQRSELILPEDTTATLTDRLATLGAQLLIETLPGWLRGETAPRPQDEAEATVTRRIKKDDGAIDWSLPATEIWRRVRAYTPWPGAATTLGETPLQILQAWPAAGERQAEPGTVLPRQGNVELPAALPVPAFAVQTGNGVLLPLVLQRSGRKALSAREFLNGERGLIGRRLGA